MDDQRTFIARLTVEVAFPYYSPYSILVGYIFQRVFCQLFQLKQFFFSTETCFAKVCQIPKVGKTEERWKKFGFFSTWLQIYFSQLHLHTKYLTIVFVFARKKKRLSSRDRQTQAKSSFPSLPFNFPFRKKKHISYSYRGIPKMKWCVLGIKNLVAVFCRLHTDPQHTYTHTWRHIIT